MNTSPTIWRDKCEATRGIREHFGSQRAFDYLVREKFLGFLQRVDAQPELAAEVPLFAAEIRSICEPAELRDLVRGVRRPRTTGMGAEKAHFAAEKAAAIERMKQQLLTA